MAALPYVAGALRIGYATSDEGDIAAGSRFFVSYTGGPPNSTDLNTLASDVAAAWATHMAPLVVEGDYLTAVTIEDLSSATAAIGTWTGSNEGSRSGDNNTASVCAVVNHQIGRKYRGGRPRTYLRAGSSSDLQTSNTWTTAFMTALLTAWEAWIAEILGVGSLSITLVDDINISYYEGFTVFMTPSGRARNIPTLRVTPLKDSITSSSIATKLGSQRRRLNV